MEGLGDLQELATQLSYQRTLPVGPDLDAARQPPGTGLCSGCSPCAWVSAPHCLGGISFSVHSTATLRSRHALASDCARPPFRFRSQVAMYRQRWRLESCLRWVSCFQLSPGAAWGGRASERMHGNSTRTTQPALHSLAGESMQPGVLAGLERATALAPLLQKHTGRFPHVPAPQVRLLPASAVV